MSDTPASAETESSGTSWSRYLKIGLPLLAVVVAVVVIGWPRWKVQIAINGLHATDGRTRAEHLEALKSNPDKELVIEELLDSVQDEGHSFAVRRMCCGLLIDHFNRLNKLNPMIRDGALHTRGVILAALMQKDYFENEYVEDPRYHVRETVLEWLRHEGDVTRTYAVQIAVTIKMQQAMADIRPLLRRSGRSEVHGRDERDLMIAAAGAVERFADCQSTPVLLEVAEQDGDYLVRLRFMQILERTAFRVDPAPACPGSVDPERMQALVRRNLDDGDHRVRMGAMLVLGQHPDWSAPAAERLQSILDGDGTPAERRQALDALVALGTPEFLERFPRYFHDRAVEVRRTAVRAVDGLPGKGFEGCLVGLVRDERPEVGVAAEHSARHALWRDVIDRLSRLAGGRKGFPQALALESARNRVGFAKDMATLFETGELVVAAPDGTLERITRAGVSEAWFRWWCGECGLDDARTEKAVEAWRGAGAAMERGDAGALRAALESLGFDAPGLFTYERGWLLARQ